MTKKQQQEDYENFKKLDHHIHKSLKFFKIASPELSDRANLQSPIDFPCGRLCSSQFECLEAAIALSRAGKASILPMVIRRMFEQHVSLLAIAFTVDPRYTRGSMGRRYIAHGQVDTWRTLSYLRLQEDRSGGNPNSVIELTEWKKLDRTAKAAIQKYQFNTPGTSWYPYGQFRHLFDKVVSAAENGTIPPDCYWYQPDKMEFEEKVLWQYASSYVHGGMMAVSTWINIDNDEDRVLQLNDAHNSVHLHVALVIATLSLSAFARGIGASEILKNNACDFYDMTPREYEAHVKETWQDV